MSVTICKLGHDCPDTPHGVCCGEPAIPERIWAWEIDHLTSPPNGYYSVEAVDDASEYIRADLCADPALLAEAVEVLRAARPHVLNMTQGWPQARFALEAIDAFLSRLENRHDR